MRLLVLAILAEISLRTCQEVGERELHLAAIRDVSRSRQRSPLLCLPAQQGLPVRTRTVEGAHPLLGI